MGREERRAEQKSRKRRLHWLEKRRKKSDLVNKVVTKLEENYDDDEIENAKAFFVDYFTLSGPFCQVGDTIEYEKLERICKDYGLELFDGDFIMDLVDEVASKETQDQTDES